jgi:hypothetical protein
LGFDVGGIVVGSGEQTVEVALWVVDEASSAESSRTRATASMFTGTPFCE